MPRFFVTYEVVTFESAEHGDAADRGYIMSGGHHVDVDTPADRDACGMSLREALNYVSPQENCGTWFTEVDARIDYRTGEHETRSLHPENITRSSYGRLCGLFGL